jgi:hypothetical protein
MLLQLSFANSQSLRAVPPTHMSLPVEIEIPVGNGKIALGSGFLMISQANFCYLVTAGHVIFDMKSQLLLGARALFRVAASDYHDTTRNELDADLVDLQSRNQIYRHKSADIVIIRLGSANDTMIYLKGVTFSRRAITGLETRGVEMLQAYDDVFVGNDIYLYGYPSSIGLMNQQQFDMHMPLLRKGIIAGKFAPRHTLIIDCPVYKGNSGGPVLQASPAGDGGTTFKIIGIATQFIPFDESRTNAISPGMLFTNSGYSVVESSDKILELITFSEQ